ncbi:E3 ubiquitin-protein ligase SPL2-like isoform X1 [Silene latifolia]|uniref:E3 ubiquitin-protein ligase SPL2-like isoform X1 n=1 Tax=Silene latifolia TaxID=37657 RepID=UPI003D77EB95
MSGGDQIAPDGVVIGIGVALAFVAIGCLGNYAATSSALQKIRDAPFVHVSDLRSLLNGGGGERLVVVRGVIESKSAIKGSCKSFWPDILVSKQSGYRAVVIQSSQKFLFNERYPNSKEVVASALRDQESTLTQAVPFVLVDSREQPLSDYVVVDLNGSKHPLPLTTVYRKMLPMPTSPLTCQQALRVHEEALRVHEYPVCMVDEEKVLPLGKDVTAVGVCSSKDGVTRIKSCEDLPYFLGEKTQDQMITDLSCKSEILFMSGIIVGFVSIAVLGYVITRKWNKWKKQWLERRRQQRNRISRRRGFGRGSV